MFFGVPAVFRVILEHVRQGNKLDTGSMRFSASAGEVLPVATWNEWKEVSGVEIIETIGTTELLHAFIHNFRSATARAARACCSRATSAS